MTEAPALNVRALVMELARLRAAIALLATRMPGAALSDDDGRILVDLLTPSPLELEAPAPPADRAPD